MATEQPADGGLSGVYTVDRVTVRYRARRDPRGIVTSALNAVSLDVDRGELLVIRGASGSGKSTLLQVMAGLTKPDEGQIFFRMAGDDGTPEELALHELDENACATARRRHIGYVYQSFQLVETMTALDNVALPLLFGGVRKRKREERAGKLLDELGLHDKWQRFPFELSGGEQQRVAIARSLVGEPSVILADEPTGSLDSDAAKRVLETIRKVHETRSLTTILVTHDDAVAKRLARRTIELRDGRILEGVR
jgi:ABC-type lipoprotein export system ATPase subunit